MDFKEKERMTEELRKEYLNKEILLLDLDNEMQSKFEYASSVFEGETEIYLQESFCWEVEKFEGFDFKFEVVKETDDITDTIVKVVSIDFI